VIARGRVLKAGQSLTVAAVDVYGVTGEPGAETLCATAFVTMRNLKLRPANQEG
jgi:acyl-coenzyme A thioesterase PaaI-like protein